MNKRKKKNKEVTNPYVERYYKCNEKCLYVYTYLAGL